VFDPNPEPKVFPPKDDPPNPNPEFVDAPPPNPPNAPVVASVPINPGLVDVGPPSTDPVAFPLAIPFTVDEPNKPKVGFFLLDPDNPRIAG
jgi:hypothetical protein